ncbi:HEAT repeat domain-containing protein [Desulfolutivibrio sulfoxidireducens]|uniref:HEAT repeat domain-containing protein n=1 Tax=Desulfolutivibrio sulfoxidireducens TaxID=2773299 RepID=UPI00159D1521|nr:HEAT repeat domain-containing protein [Desulfolutivibrio sulfoxidireducens]QLA20369.1 HEAT repeat domain-containing protein [Desulfolutivibrio sulfoxidireducens]
MTDCKEIVTKLSAEDIDALREAAYEAGEMGCVQAVPRLAALLASASLGVQEAADFALRKIGGKEVVTAVLPLLRSDEAPVRNLSMDILRQVGGDDFSSLVALLHDPDADIRIFGTDILGSTGNRLAVVPLCDALLKDPEVNVRYQAAVSLGELGQGAAAKCLGKAMEDDEWVQFAVIEALAKLRDASSVGALVKALDKSSDLVASMIVEALGEIGNIKAVAMLIRRMDASPAVLRNKIVKAVLHILGGKSLTLLPAKDRGKFRDYLLAALSDDDTEIQDAAIRGLTFMGDAAASGDILRMAAGMDPDAEPERLEAAVGALAAIGLSDNLRAGLSHADPGVRRIAVTALSRIGGEKTSELLISAYPGADAELRRNIAAALGQVAGPEAGDFFLGLVDQARDEAVLKAALSYLGRKMRVEAAGERIFTLLSDPRDDVKEAALEALTEIGGEDMRKRFQALAGDPDPVNRLMAVYALGRIGGPDNLELISKALLDEVSDIRKIALEAALEFCGEDEKGLELIVSRLDDEAPEVRRTVVELLGRCPRGLGAPYLSRALADPDDWVRVRAVEALGVLRAAEAVPRLIPLLGDASKLVALKAAQALGDIGGESAFRALLETLGNEDPEMQAASEEAIARIQDRQGDR